MSVDYGPLDFIGLRNNETQWPPLMVLCRAPADDGWLAIEAGTAIIYNIFDTVSYLYGRWEKTTGRSQAAHEDFRSRPAQARMLARAKWWHHPEGIETVGIPEWIREMGS
jgi:hypothetical protein